MQEVGLRHGMSQLCRDFDVLHLLPREKEDHACSAILINAQCKYYKHAKHPPALQMEYLHMYHVHAFA